jgi:hypothetical protein
MHACCPLQEQSEQMFLPLLFYIKPTIFPWATLSHTEVFFHPRYLNSKLTHGVNDEDVSNFSLSQTKICMLGPQRPLALYTCSSPIVGYRLIMSPKKFELFEV